MITNKMLALILLLSFRDGTKAEIRFNNDTFLMGWCGMYDPVEFGTVTYSRGPNPVEIAKIKCDPGYDLVPDTPIICHNGEWPRENKPRCVRHCPPPLNVKNGIVTLENLNENKDEEGWFKKGTLATYSCNDGFKLFPPESQYRVCEQGIWTGPVAKCLPNKQKARRTCPTIKFFENGGMIKHGASNVYGDLFIGSKITYSCNSGYSLVGAKIMVCEANGQWNPKIPPICVEHPSVSASEYSCEPIKETLQTSVTVAQGYMDNMLAVPNTLIEVNCIGKYRASHLGCMPTILNCSNGQWIGTLPTCEVADFCFNAPAVPHATVVNMNAQPTSMNHYPLMAQVVYQCDPGYEIAENGNDILTCALGGCWRPEIPPVCKYTGLRNMEKSSDGSGHLNGYYFEFNSMNAILLSAAAGAGVLGLLVMICMVVLCRRRKPISRTVAIAPPAQRQEHNDQTALLNGNLDRLALIADNVNNSGSQSSLPTYDEATRERGAGGVAANRLHRPHWPNLASRRARNSPNSDSVHVARHGSFASHTPSTRSAGDSMGSTDTVAISDGSTIVTLDTASSHSGSQPASCRAHCGSLGSFDTCSIINPEDVPLLEESELEEVQVNNNVNLVLEQTSISDTSSLKAQSEMP